MKYKLKELSNNDYSDLINMETNLLKIRGIENPNDYLHISFEKQDKAFIKTYGDDNSPELITMQELKAINKQIEEFGWNK